MPKTEEKDKLNPSDKNYHDLTDREVDSAFNVIADQNPDLDARGDQVEADERDKKSVKEKEKDAESSAGQKLSDKNGDDAAQYSYYRGLEDGGKPGLGKRLYGSFKLASNWKKGAAVGGIAGIAMAIVAFFAFLSTFQLVHMVESLEEVLDAQSNRVHSRRAANHYRIATDVDGRTYFKKTGVGRIANGYSALNPESIHNDLRSKGYTVEYDPGANRLKINGEIVEGKLKERRNILRQILDEEYHNDSWFKRNMRSRTAFRTYGIQRTFFENTSERVGDWELRIIDKLRTRLRTTGAKLTLDTNQREQTTEDGTPREGVDTDSINSDAQDIAEKMKDPKYNPDTDPRLSVDPDLDLSKINIASTAGSTALNTVKISGAADAACEAKYWLLGIELGAIALRHSALIKHYMSVAVAAHQIKNGDNVSAAEISGLMAVINRNTNIGQSGSYQLLSGNADAKVTTTDKYALSFATAGGAAGALSRVNTLADDVLSTFTAGNADKYCDLSRRGWYQAGSLVLGAAVFLVPGVNVAAAAGKATVALTISGLVEIGKAIFQPIFIQMMAGALIHYYEDSDELYDAFAGGGMAKMSADNYQNGLNNKLNPKQTMEVQNAIAQEYAEDHKDDSVYTKYFALDNSQSFLSKQLFALPSSPEKVAKSTGGYVASLPSKFASSLYLLTPQGYAKAASNEANPLLTQDPFGINPYGMSEKDLIAMEDIGIIENEEWIYANGGIEEYQAWVDTCYPEDDELMLSGLAIEEGQLNKLQEKCTIGDGTSGTNWSEGGNEKYFRYAIYRIDRNIQQRILFSSKATDCTDPDSEEWDCIDDYGVGTAENLFCGDESLSSSAPPEDYTLVSFRGVTVNERTKQMILTAEEYYGGQFDITQGSYNAGGVAASGGTHDGGGAIDIAAANLSTEQSLDIVRALRQAGFAAWLRTPEEGNWGAHIHAIAIGDRDLSNNAAAQVNNYFDGLNGLVNNAPDPHLEDIGRPIPAWAEEFGESRCATPVS